jgi:hypothetical protein
MTKKILLQFDTDTQPSIFDSIVAADAGVDMLLRQHGVAPHSVRELVYGAIFTRSPDDLRRTAIFVGGSNVGIAEAVVAEILRTFFGPMRVSILLDPAGANTTAAAAVNAAAKHIKLENTTALVLGATGPVGQRVVRLLGREHACVRVSSRKLERAQGVCDAVLSKVAEAQLTAWAASTPEELRRATEGVDLVIAAGAAGAELLPLEIRQAAKSLRVAIDLNAVPPAGIGGIEAGDRAVVRDDVVCYGAIGIGGTKMKIHKAAIQQLFEDNDQVLDAEELYDHARGI